MTQITMHCWWQPINENQWGPMRAGTQSSGSKNIPAWGWPCWRGIQVPVPLLSPKGSCFAWRLSATMQQTMKGGDFPLSPGLIPESSASLALAGTLIPRTYLCLSVFVCVSLILSPSLLSLSSSHHNPIISLSKTPFCGMWILFLE